MSAYPDLKAENIQALADASRDLAAWRAEVSELADAVSGQQWRGGDLLVKGENAFGKKAYKEAASALGKSTKTLYCWVYVAQKFPVATRHSNLRWEHHQVVAGLPEDQQAHWFARAENEHLSAKQVRAKLKTGRGVAKQTANVPIPLSEKIGRALDQIRRALNNPDWQAFRSEREMLKVESIPVLEEMISAYKLTSAALLEQIAPCEAQIAFLREAHEEEAVSA